MGFIKWLLWTSFAIGFGIFLASYRVEGKTPADHLAELWGEKAPKQARLDSIKDAIEEARQHAIDKLETPAQGRTPTERHTPADRARVNKLIAKRASGT
jgi:hypothetical protein